METNCRHSAGFIMGVGAASLAVVLILILANKHASARFGGDRPDNKAAHMVRTACGLGAKASQDSNPIVSLVHATTAKAYLDAAQHVSPAGFAKAGVDAAGDIRENIASLTRKAMQQITQKCPALGIGGADRFVVGAGWVA